MAKKIYIQKYKKDADTSYALGPFPAMELLKRRPQDALQLVMDPEFHGREEFAVLCRERSIPVVYDKNTLERLSEKDICLAAAEFKKFDTALDASSPHVLLVEPSDMGNVGTILRTLLGLGIKDIALVEPCADVFHPRCVRASMGAVFSVRTRKFAQIEEYLSEFRHRTLYPFLVDSSVSLEEVTPPDGKAWTLVFGNESRGLPDSFSRLGQPVRIPQTEDVDSLNLAVAVALGAYRFLHRK